MRSRRHHTLSLRPARTLFPRCERLHGLCKLNSCVAGLLLGAEAPLMAPWLKMVMSPAAARDSDRLLVCQQCTGASQLRLLPRRLRRKLLPRRSWHASGQQTPALVSLSTDNLLAASQQSLQGLGNAPEGRRRAFRRVMVWNVLCLSRTTDTWHRATSRSTRLCRRPHGRRGACDESSYWLAHVVTPAAAYASVGLPQHLRERRSPDACIAAWGALCAGHDCNKDGSHRTG